MGTPASPGEAVAGDAASLRAFAVELAHGAGRLLLEARPTGQTRKSSPTDIVTDADRAAERFIVDRIRSARPDDSLLARGLLDSLSILKIVTFCEEQFGVTIPDAEVLPEHFDSIRAIARLVEKRRASA